MFKQGLSISLINHLQVCIQKKDLATGRKVHHIVVECSLFRNSKLGSLLIQLFASFGSLPEALQVFHSFPKQSVHTWTGIIAAHVWHGRSEDALLFYGRMQNAADVEANSYTYVTVLNACANAYLLDHGKLIHADSIIQGLNADQYVGNALIDAYSKCGSLDDACRVFDSLPKQDVVSWNAMIAGYVHYENNEKALQLFYTMQAQSVAPNETTCTCILKACTNNTDLQQAMHAHTYILKEGFEMDLHVGNALVVVYAKCGKLADAQKVFDLLSVRNMLSWSAIIAGYAEFGHVDNAFVLFKKLHWEGLHPNAVACVSLLQVCACTAALDYGKLIHFAILENDLDFDACIQSALIDMYAKCNTLLDAKREFELLREHDIVLWSALIAGYAEGGSCDEALYLFAIMLKEDIMPNDYTYVSLFKACGTVEALLQGKLLHADVINTGLETHMFIGNALVNMYAKCGSLEDAEELFYKLRFRDVVTWSAMIGGYADHGKYEEALHMYIDMRLESTEPNDYTYGGVLRACSNLELLDQGRLIHCDIMQQELELGLSLGNTLVDMYVRCKSLEDAGKVFNKLLGRDTTTWNSILSGHFLYGNLEEVLELFGRMKNEGIEPNELTFVCILRACGGLAALDGGKQVHTGMIEQGIQPNLLVGTTVVDMYAKCGNLEDAYKLFEALPVKDIVAWNAVLAGYANYGDWENAVSLFGRMQQAGLSPVEVTFVCLLSACSHAGLLSEGFYYFTSMAQDYCVVPTIQHYVCMIDLLGRAGFVDEAEDLLHEVPFQPDNVVWVSLLASSVRYNNAEIGGRAFDCLIKDDITNVSGFFLMHNLYATIEREGVAF